MYMELQFKKMSPDMTNDFFDYFENIGFTDNKDFSMCYCLESHISSDEDEMLDTKEKRQAKAKNLIETGKMNGYLIYDGNNLIGWCNADDKINYEPLVLNDEYRTADDRKGVIKSIFCMEIAPQYRGQGLSHVILDYICQTAKKEGFSYVEGYPFKDKKFKYQYHGPIHLYEKHGFKIVAEKSYFIIMRKTL